MNCRVTLMCVFYLALVVSSAMAQVGEINGAWVAVFAVLLALSFYNFLNQDNGERP